MTNWKVIINAARHYGLKKAIPIIRFTFLRNQLDRNYQRRLRTNQSNFNTLPGKLLEVKTLVSGAHFLFEHAQLEIIFLAPDLARLTWQPGVLPVPYAIAKTEWPSIKISHNQENCGWQLASTKLSILIGKHGSIHFFDDSNRLLHDDLPPMQTLNPDSPVWTSQSHLFQEECIYGLGEQTCPLNRRGAQCRMWNTDPKGAYKPGDDPIYMPLPVYMGMHYNGSYLVFFENTFPATFRFDPPAQGEQTDHPNASFVFEGGALRYYFIQGKPANILERFSELTGRPGLPPRWSLGYHQSRWGYQSQADIRRVVKGFQQHGLPLSAIHLDIDYMHGFRVFTVDRHRFPDLARLRSELEDQGIKLVTIIDPSVKQDPNYFLYQEGLEQDAFCRLADGRLLVGVVWPGWSVYPDFTHPKVRAWWGRAYMRLLEAGVAGFWHDMNEPTSFALTGGPFLPFETQHKMEGQGGDHRQGHNLYALLMNRAGHESLRQRRPEQRPWILSRSGWVSQSRYAWNWTGDASTSWESLRLTIPLILGASLSGQPYNGPDIGGFSGNPSAELYLRWFQMAAFLPFFRTHSAQGAAPREPWSFGEPYTRIIRNYLRLRYQLMPYLYNLAWEASQTGQPIIRPLFWNDPEATELWQIEDAFLVGDALLVAPILEEGQKWREVFFPRGKWYSLWDDTVYSGPGKMKVECGLENIPVFVRAGSLLPLQEKLHLALHLYPPEPGNIAQYRLFSDAGDGSPTPAKSDIRLDDFQIIRSKDSFEINWQNEGGYPFPYPKIELLIHAFSTRQAWLNKSPLPVEGERVALPPLQGNKRMIKLVS